MKAKVLNIPIRYNKQTYRKGDIFEIKEEDLKGIENLVEIVEEAKKPPKKQIKEE